ncbi:MAG TPA: FAD-binding oxidoreductase [Acidimicrobiales bacterium]
MDTITKLSDEVRGPVLTPGQPGYDDERAGFQRDLDHRPGVIVGALDAADVQAAVRFAAAEGRPVAVQATGHGRVAGAGENAVLISTRRMAAVRVEPDGPDGPTAGVEAGATWTPVIEQAAAHGLAPLSGSSPDVGVVGYTLGGGFGLLSRRYGYAADRVRRIEVVTADGERRLATPESEPDLFWALRGGRDNLGVVTGIEVELFPVPRLYGGGLYFAAEHAAAVLDAYRRWTATVPDAMGSSLGLVPIPDLPMVPEPIRGRYVAHLRIAYAGDAAEGERLVAPLRAVAPRLLERLEEMPYTASGTIHNDPPVPHAYHGSGLLLRALDDDGARAVLDLAGPEAAVPTVVQLRHAGGAMRTPPPVPNAVGHRDAELLLSVISIVGEDGDAEGADAARAAAHELHGKLAAALAPLTAGASLNYLYGRGATSELVRAAYEPATRRRLAELKRAYDPDNLFRLNPNVPPGAAGSEA